MLQRRRIHIEFLQRIYFMHINGHAYNPQIMREIGYLATIPGFSRIVQGPANYIPISYTNTDDQNWKIIRRETHFRNSPDHILTEFSHRN